MSMLGSLYLIGWITRLVMLVLVGLSIWSISIIVERKRYFNMKNHQKTINELNQLLGTKAKKEALYAWAKNRSDSPLAKIILLTENFEGDTEALQTTFRLFISRQKSIYENDLTILATLASNAPFIGLFGTVLGIIQAFGNLVNAQNVAGQASPVMVAIAESLLATAIGLLVAIPAGMAYNYFTRKIKILMNDCDIVFQQMNQTLKK